MEDRIYHEELYGKIIVLEYNDGCIDIARGLSIRSTRTENGEEWTAEHAKPIALNEQYIWPRFKHRGDLTCNFATCWSYAHCGLVNVREATPEEVQFYNTQSAKY